MEYTAAMDRDGNTASVGFGLFLVSFVVLAYEVAQLRVFAYSLHPVLAYSVIAITMLGFGLASTVLSLSPRLRTAPLRPLLAASCLLLALVGLVANVVFARASSGMHVSPDLASTFTVTTLGLVLLLLLPYACGGLCVALVLSRHAARPGGYYFLNLLGSAVGCVIINFVLAPLGAERLTLALLALAAVAAVGFAGREAPRLRLAAGATALLLLAGLAVAPRLLPFQPDPSDQHVYMANGFRAAHGIEPVREFATWDPVARVEVHSWPGQKARLPHPVSFKFMTQDAGAGSILAKLDEDPERGARVFDNTFVGFPVGMRPRGDVLIIGLGGGPDVQAALHHHARSITGVEINRSVIRIVRDTFADFVGRPYAQPGVEIVLGDGRSFVRRTPRRFDVIVMSGVDTVTPQSSGSYVLAEDYLYTTDAFGDYVGALNETGILAIMRFTLEPVRLSLMAAAALRRKGVEHPERHIVVLGHALTNLLLVKRTPWTPAELEHIDRLEAVSRTVTRDVGLPGFDALQGGFTTLYAPHRPHADALYGGLFDIIAAGKEPPIVLPTDDRPYYFSAEWVQYFTGQNATTTTGGVLTMYARFMLIVVALALAAIVLPLALRRRRELAVPGAAPTLAYFFALGFCFMFLEIGLIQQAILAVEHPTYSVAVVLSALLGATALGALLSQRLRWPEGRVVLLAAAGIAVVGGTYAFALSPLLQALLPLRFGARMALLVLLIAPLGVALGMLFPAGLRRLGSGPGAPLVPWAVAVNGFASVIGSLLSLPFAVLFGFRTLFGAGVVIYLLGCLAFARLPRAAESGNNPGDVAPAP
jgi:hypothetical protein